VTVWPVGLTGSLLQLLIGAAPLVKISVPEGAAAPAPEVMVAIRVTPSSVTGELGKTTSPVVLVALTTEL
jgi:hypothetical protein